MAVREVEFVIVGGGVAAAKAAEGLRSAGGDGPTLLLTAEPELPYERPPLSKAFLRGEAGRDKTRTHDEAWYRDHEVELLLATRASTLDPATRTVTTEVGDQLHYGAGLVLAASATQMDTRVTLLELADTLWTRAVGPEMGRFFEAFLRDRGVHVRTRTKAERLEGRDTVEAVGPPHGSRLAADLVVIGVGVRPDTDLAERAGLPVDNG